MNYLCFQIDLLVDIYLLLDLILERKIMRSIPRSLRQLGMDQQYAAMDRQESVFVYAAVSSVRELRYGPAGAIHP